MHGPAHWAWGHCPVRWLNRHALVTLPERFEEPNARLVSEQLLSIVDSDALVLILDMTATAACDHAGGDVLAQVYQRAMARGTELRPVVTDEGVRRVLTVSGIGRLVPVYATVGAALAATRPGDNIAAAASGIPGQLIGPPRSEPRGRAGGRPRGGSRALHPDGDVGTEVALLDRDGVIVSVNGAWRAFAAANGGDPARTGPGVSFLDVCAAAGDPVAGQVADAIRDALADRLPDALTVEVPCHSPRTERWFDMLISARRDNDGHCVGATVTLSLARSQTRLLRSAGAPGGSGMAGRPGEGGRGEGGPGEGGPGEGGPGEGGPRADAAFVGELTGRLAGVARILEESATQAGAGLAGQLHRAASELDAVIRDAHTAIAPREPGPPS